MTCRAFSFMHWKTSCRQLSIESPLVMGILNVTPDSFSDGGRYANVDAALRRAEQMIADGADIIDIGGESTRPGSSRVDADTELERTAPVIEAIAKRFDTPISIDTSKSAVAKAGIDAGAEIINDISGLRWDPQIAEIAAATGAGLILMHSRGEFETMHSQPSVDDVISEVIAGLKWSIDRAMNHGVSTEQICLDVGIGFGKTPEQNLELIAKLDTIVDEFADLPVLVGASRKSFLGKLFGGAAADDRLGGSIAAALIGAERGAMILRVHDVKETAQALRFVNAVNDVSI